jgi:spermidine dehydrogenase
MMVDLRGHHSNGSVAIANSDAAWDAYLHAAIDQASRAVEDLNGV